MFFDFIIMFVEVSNKSFFWVVRIWIQNILVFQFFILCVKYWYLVNGYVDIVK